MNINKLLKNCIKNLRIQHAKYVSSTAKSNSILNEAIKITDDFLAGWCTYNKLDLWPEIEVTNMKLSSTKSMLTIQFIKIDETNAKHLVPGTAWNRNNSIDNKHVEMNKLISSYGIVPDIFYTLLDNYFVLENKRSIPEYELNLDLMNEINTLFESEKGLNMFNKMYGSIFRFLYSIMTLNNYDYTHMTLNNNFNFKTKEENTIIFREVLATTILLSIINNVEEKNEENEVKMISKKPMVISTVYNDIDIII
jgi:hypothetical protein